MGWGRLARTRCEPSHRLLRSETSSSFAPVLTRANCQIRKHDILRMRLSFAVRVWRERQSHHPMHHTSWRRSQSQESEDVSACDSEVSVTVSVMCAMMCAVKPKVIQSDSESDWESRNCEREKQTTD